MLLAQLGIDPLPLGLRTPQPSPLHYRAYCWTATLFSFYLIGFFHSETNVKGLAAQPGINARPLGFEHHRATTIHHRDFSILPNPFLSLLSQLTLWLFKGLGAQARNRFSFLGLWAPQPWPCTTPPWQRQNAFSFFTLLNPFFSLWNRLKKKARGPAGNRACPTNLEHHTPT